MSMIRLSGDRGSIRNRRGTAVLPMSGRLAHGPAQPEGAPAPRRGEMPEFIIAIVEQIVDMQAMENGQW